MELCRTGDCCSSQLQSTSQKLFGIPQYWKVGSSGDINTEVRSG